MYSVTTPWRLTDTTIVGEKLHYCYDKLGHVDFRPLELLCRKQTEKFRGAHWRNNRRL